jgi:hypothetical protein
MKPRPSASMLTSEDLITWGKFLLRWSPAGADPYGTSMEADRRDADLMWELVDLRSIGAYGDVRHLQIMAGQDGCSVGGWMGHYRWVSSKWSDGRPLVRIMETMTNNIKQRAAQVFEKYAKIDVANPDLYLLCKDLLEEVERLERASVTMSVKAGEQLERIADALDRISANQCGD